MNAKTMVFVRRYWLRFNMDFSGTTGSAWMKVYEERKFKRVKCNFMVTLFNEKQNLFVQGVTVNLSQYGALVRIQPHFLFRPGMPLTITVFLPPEFTGQDEAIRLQGEAVISRIDEANRGIAVEFCKALRQFERIGKMGLH
jgi:hypothetical protein